MKTVFKYIPEKKFNHFLIFYLIFITSSFFALIMRANLMVYNLIVLLPSAVYLLYLNHRSTKKIVLEALLVGLFGELLLDRFAHSSRAWFSPSMFSWRPLGLPIENYIWVILYVLLTFAYYEYFFDRSRSEKLPKQHKYWLIITVGTIILIPILYSIFPGSFVVTAFYAVAVVGIILVDILLFAKYKRLVSKLFVASLLVLPLAFIHEFVSLELMHWVFEEGYHIGYLVLFGYSIPWEEIIFYLVAPVTVMAIYELAVDDHRY